MDICVRRGEKVESLGRLISVYRGGKKRNFLVIEYLLIYDWFRFLFNEFWNK